MGSTEQTCKKFRAALSLTGHVQRFIERAIMNEEANAVEHPPSHVNTADILESADATDYHPEPGSALGETVEPMPGVDPVALDPTDDVIPVTSINVEQPEEGATE